MRGTISCPVCLKEAVALRGMGFPTIPTESRNNRRYTAKLPNTSENRIQIREAITNTRAKIISLVNDSTIKGIEAKISYYSEEELVFNGNEVAVLLNCDPTIPFERNDKVFDISIPYFALDEVEEKVGTFSRLFENLHNKIKHLQNEAIEGDEEV